MMRAVSRSSKGTSSSRSNRDELRKALANVGLVHVDAAIMSQCLALANTHRIAPNRLAECWEAVSLNKNVDELNAQTFPSFREALLRDADASSPSPMVVKENPKSSAMQPESPPIRPKSLSGAIVARPALGKRNGANTAPATNTDANMDLDAEESLPSVTPPAKRHSAARAMSTTTMTSASTSAYHTAAVTPTSSRRVSLSPAPPPNHEHQSSSPSSYTQRSNAGKVLLTFQPTLSITTGSSSTTKTAPQKPCLIDTKFDTNVTQTYRHLFTTPIDRARALDAHLMQLGHAITAQQGWKPGSATTEDEDEDPMVMDPSTDRSTALVVSLEAVGVPRQNTICCIGRICNSAHDGRLNATSVLLEGSRHESGGARIRVDLSQFQQPTDATSTSSSYSLFPGQIVAIQGMNPSGHSLVAQHVWEGAAHPLVVTPVSQLRKLQVSQPDESDNSAVSSSLPPLKIITACGPFTARANLEYEPLADLIRVVRDQQPHVVLLTGPFVDLQHHDSVRAGQCTVQYEDGEQVVVTNEAVFANKVAALLEELYLQEPDQITQFVLVPSLEDATAEWVYPQPPMQDSAVDGGYNSEIPGAEGIELGTLGLHHVERAGRDEGTSAGTTLYPTRRRVHLVSNPCTLRINEVVVGITSTDAMFHISTEETNACLPTGSRLTRIAQHMLNQRSYYPLFPAKQQHVNLDWKHHEQWSMPCRPDLLIVPSKLACFARNVMEGTLVVNPGRLCRDMTGGTYAIMNIHPLSQSMVQQADEEVERVTLPHAVPERTMVEIKYI